VAFERAYHGPDGLQWDVHVVDAAGQLLHRLTHTPEDEEVLGWRSSPQQIIFDREFGPQFLSDRSEVFVLAPTEQAQEEKVGDLPSVNNRVLSPDGAWLAVTIERDDAVHSDVSVAPVGGGMRRRLPRNYVAGGLPQWSPDGRQLAYADGAETFRVVGRDGRTLGRVGGNYPVWSPDGRMIVYFGLDQVRVYDLTTRESRRLGRIDADELAWSPDGRAVLYGRGGDIWASPVGGGRSRRIFSTGRDGFDCLTFSPNGRRVAFLRLTERGGFLDPPETDLVLANADGSDMRTVPSAGIGG
jgi:Tol biopolymer transport system component